MFVSDYILFGRDEKTIRKHINNAFSDGELIKENNTQKMRVDGVKQNVPFYTLDVVISVGYRVKSQRGVEFRQWANSVLKQYIINGYAINEKRLAALQKTVEIQTKMLADTLEIEQKEVLQAVNLYTDALVLLDQYDHQSIVKPEGAAPIYMITFADGCKRIAASLFLEFLSRNKALFRDGHKVISDGALVAITLMIAESNPEEKEIMTALVMNLLKV